MKVSSHFEYLENRSRGLDVTWQPIGGDLNVPPWTLTLPWGLSVGRETPSTEPVYCVTVAFTDLINFNVDFKFGEKPEVAGSQICAVRGADNWVM